MSLIEKQEAPGKADTASHSGAASRSAVLAALAADLEALNRDIEGEFFLIGSKMIECAGTVNVMTSGLTAFASLVSGDHGTRAAQALSDVLSFSADMKTRAEEAKWHLTKMRHESEQLSITLAEFNNTASAFHSLGVRTRAETRRLRDLGFDLNSLAEDVRFLALHARSKVQTALETAGELTPQIDNALLVVETLQDEQMGNLHTVIAQVSASLTEFSAMQEDAHASSLRLGREYREISGSFKKLIMGLQFHDITRQRLEHVSDALRRVSLHYQEEKPGVARESATGAAVLELQSLQIADTGEKFSAAVSAVLSSLDSLVSHMQKIVDEGRALSGLSGHDKTPFFLQMEFGCTSILSTLNTCTLAETVAVETTKGLLVVIARMRASIEDVRVIESQMQRTGMHARTSAEKLGAEGEALSALGESIKQRAFESRKGSDALMNALDSLNEAANRSYGQEQMQTAGDLSAHQLCLDRMRIAVGELRSSQENGCQHIAEIGVPGQCLVRDLITTRTNFTLDARFSDAVTRVQRELKAAIEQSQCTCVGDASEEALAEFVGQYTMQREVEVYEGLIKALGKSVPVPSPEMIAAEASDDTFDDNIELF
jgi:hypothetical protein